MGTLEGGAIMSRQAATKVAAARRSRASAYAKRSPGTSATAAVKFLWSLPTEKVHVTAIHPDRQRPKNIKGRSYPRTAAGRAEAQRWIELAQKDGWGIYFNGNDLSADLGAGRNKASESEVSHVRMLHVDADLPKDTSSCGFFSRKSGFARAP